jgi:hypothetical protein
MRETQPGLRRHQLLQALDSSFAAKLIWNGGSWERDGLKQFSVSTGSTERGVVVVHDPEATIGGETNRGVSGMSEQIALVEEEAMCIGPVTRLKTPIIEGTWG